MRKKPIQLPNKRLSEKAREVPINQKTGGRRLSRMAKSGGATLDQENGLFMARSTLKRAGGRSRETAETLAAKQKDISVSEFFAKNRHLLGFDNPRKALLTTVKEAVDNSLDACEEAGVLPNVTVVIEELQPDRPPTAQQSRHRATLMA